MSGPTAGRCCWSATKYLLQYFIAAYYLATSSYHQLQQHPATNVNCCQNVPENKEIYHHRSSLPARICRQTLPVPLVLWVQNTQGNWSVSRCVVLHSMPLAALTSAMWCSQVCNVHKNVRMQCPPPLQHMTRWQSRGRPGACSCCSTDMQRRTVSTTQSRPAPAVHLCLGLHARQECSIM